MTPQQISTQLESLKRRIKCLKHEDVEINSKIEELLLRIETLEQETSTDIENITNLIDVIQSDIETIENILPLKADLVGGVVPNSQLPTNLLPLYVNTYNDLPPANLNNNKTYGVLNSQGTSWLPGSLGGSYYSKGYYYSNGSTWIFMGSFPNQATQLDVDAGIITDQFVSPNTFINSSKWNTKENTLISGTNIKTINSTSILGAGNIDIGGANTGDSTNINGLIAGNGTTIYAPTPSQAQQAVIPAFSNTARVAIDLGTVPEGYTVYDTDWKCEFAKQESTWVQKNIPNVADITAANALPNKVVGYKCFVISANQVYDWNGSYWFCFEDFVVPDGFWYVPYPFGGVYSSAIWGATAGGAENRFHFFQFTLKRKTTIAEMACFHAVANDGVNARMRFLIYQGETGLPTTLLGQWDSANGSLNTANKLIKITTNITLEPGVYFWAGAPTGLNFAGANPTFGYVSITRSVVNDANFTFTSNHAKRFISVMPTPVSNPTMSFDQSNFPPQFLIYFRKQ